MLTLGIDVFILMCVGVALTAIASLLACSGMEKVQGETCIISVFVTSLSYVIAYIVMVNVLDAMMGL